MKLNLLLNRLSAVLAEAPQSAGLSLRYNASRLRALSASLTRAGFTPEIETTPDADAETRVPEGDGRRPGRVDTLTLWDGTPKPDVEKPDMAEVSPPEIGSPPVPRKRK